MSNEDETVDGSGQGGPPDDGREDELAENLGHRFARLPTTADDRAVEGRASREEVVGYFAERFGIPAETWDGYTFWEKGAGKVWAYRGEAPDGIEVESLGMTVLRTRQEHWKPTTDGVQRFGREADSNVLELDRDAATRFLAGEEQDLGWDGDWGYLIVAHELAGGLEPIGVGLYTYGTLRSVVPKGRRRQL